MTNNHEDPSSPDPKSAAKQKSGNKTSISRRSALKLAGVVAIGGLCTSATAPIHAATTQKTDITPKNTILPDTARIQELRSNAETRQKFMAGVHGIAKNMVNDRPLAAKLLENVDSVQLVNLYNQNLNVLEPITGKIDGRTNEGRYVKMLVAAELFSGVSGVDRVLYSPGSEELVIGENAGVTPTSGSSCSGCAIGSSVLGCCVLHFWSWAEGSGLCC